MQNEIKSSIKKIDVAKKILILISSPDGDSVGTSIVLKHFLENKNKIADIYSNKPLYDTLKKLPLSDEIIITDVVKINFHEYDLIITVDTANLEQLYNYNKYDKFKFPDYIDFVCIDHHASNTSFTKYKIYDKEASSTAEVLYTHLIKNDFPLNKDEATLLYFAIASDTGFFRWQIKPETFRVASKLLESNVDYNKLANLYFENIDENFKDILSVFVKKTVFHKRLKYTSLYIDENIINKLKISKENMKNYIDTYRSNFLINIKDYKFSIIIKDVGDFRIISFRGNPFNNKLDLTLINKYYDFQGGGHKNACSFSSKGNYKDIIKNIDIAIKDLESLN